MLGVSIASTLAFAPQPLCRRNSPLASCLRQACRSRAVVLNDVIDVVAQPNDDADDTMGSVTMDSSFVGLSRPMAISYSVIGALFAAMVVSNAPLSKFAAVRAVAKVIYVVGGVAIGYGGTQWFRFAQSAVAKEQLAALFSQARALLSSLSPRAKLRALLLRLDPSLAEDQDKAITLRDALGPWSRLGKKKRSPKPPWAKRTPPS